MKVLGRGIVLEKRINVISKKPELAVAVRSWPSAVPFYEHIMAAKESTGIVKTKKKAEKAKPAEPKCEDCERKPLPYAFEKELIDNQNKHIRMVYEFVAINRGRPIDVKFYARHEQQMPSFEKYLPLIECGAQRRRTKSGYPLLESQIYGWLPNFNTMTTNGGLRDLNFVIAPKGYDELSKFNERVTFDRTTERPPFNGLRFFLR